MKTLGKIYFTVWLYINPAITGLCQSDDIAGNQYPASRYDEPTAYQIVITEIMADPNPPVGLPDAEYIEIFNRGESTVNLNGFRLIIGKIQKIMPDVLLEPHAYRIVCDAKTERLFTDFGETLPVVNMPPILNSGQTITLKSRAARVICSVEFTDRWYRSRNKAAGGWSLEMIDPDNVCGRADNWCESVDPRGGTPGARNAVNALNPDRQKPALRRATMNPDSSVQLHFSESMDSSSLIDPSNYSANCGLLHPVCTDPVEPGYTSVVLDFGTHLHSGVTYSLTVLNALKDCAGNPLDYNAHASFGLSQAADSFDVVINEILFDASAGESEFIELYNRSSKILDLAEFTIRLCDPISDSTIRQITLKNNAFLLFPQNFAVLTRNADHLPDPANRLDLSDVVEQPALFTLPDKDGEIALVNPHNQIIDQFRYSWRMHSAFLSKTEGISLERLEADQSTNDINNWCSASSLSGYGTPGHENSQLLMPDQDKAVQIIPAVFSPDGDGLDDVAVLTLEPGKPGFMANILIFDTHGRMIKTLVSNAWLGSETILTWDGLRNDQTQADIGIYLIYIELFNQHGEIQKYRKVVTLARKL